MDTDYNFVCEKCGNTTYLFSENEWDKILICEKCANIQLVETKKQRPIQNIPHCPTCNSTNVSKIGTGERVGSVAMLGLFSKKINKSFRCRNCGYTW